MKTSAALGAARTAFGALVDYAGLFPPAQLSLPDAVEEYDAARKGPYAWMLGRFIVPASRLTELAAAVGEREPFAVSVIVDSDPEPRRWFGSAQQTAVHVAAVRQQEPRLRVEALESPLPPPLSARETYDAAIGQLAALLARASLRDLPTFVEWPRNERWEELLPGAMVAAARARLGAKIRCGGVVASAVPSVAEVAAFVDAAATEHVPFKATAGLHHPVRHFNEAAGFTMHGFLNLLAAAAFAHEVDRATLESIVAEEDPAAFALCDDGFSWRGDRAGAEELALVRESEFIAYGSCSFSEPVEDLVALRMLARA